MKRNLRRSSIAVWLAALAAASGCGPSAPTSSSVNSFLAGQWQGTVTVEQNPGESSSSAPISATTTWTFEAVPLTNGQTFRTTIRTTHPWLPSTMSGTTALTPGNTPPADISTQGVYASPRGCQGTFASIGAAETRHIDASFTGVDCDHMTFGGHVVLTKD